MSTVIAKNQTASALPLDQLPVPDNEIPASGQVTLTDFASVSEIQEDAELAAHIAAADAILNIDGTDLSAADSAAWAVPLTVASTAEVDTGAEGSKAVSPAALAGSALAIAVTANTAKVSAAGSVTTHSDVTSAGSGAIITSGERSAISTNSAKVSADGSVTTHNDVTDAGSGAIITSGERTKLSGIETGADVTDAANVAGAGAVMASLADVKGDILVATADDTVARLAVGTDTYVLTADSSEASGLKWAAGGGGGTTAKMACCPYGAKSDSTGKFLIANGKSTDADDSSKPKTRHAAPLAGTLIALVYQTKEGTTDTQMKVHKNGASAQTVTLDNINATFGGAETLSISVVAGDKLEIEYDADDKPGECTMYFVLEYSL